MVMITIHETVKNILESEEEALYALAYGFMNLSAYAERIQKEVERRSHKQVKRTGIVVALSRIQNTLKKKHPMIQDIKISNITTKLPLTEIIYAKTPEILSKLSSFYEKVKTEGDDFLTMTLSTTQVSVICSDRLKEQTLKHFEEKPRVSVSRLAAIGLSLDDSYYPLPNITFSLIRRIARKRIPLAETISTHNEIIFIFDQKYLSDIVNLFSVE